ncbi:MAG: nucleoside hydrolase [Acidimicrobiales bacterium]
MISLLLDCDPGIDDAVALCLAAGCPDVDFLGVTTVAGNHVLERTTHNARAVLALAGSPVPVTAGCDRPLLRKLRIAPEIHGETGLGAGPPPVSDVSGVPLLDGHAANRIVEVTRTHPGEVTLVAIGPLTNLAVALRLDPGLADRVGSVVVMGGATTRGNTTPAAEFNIYGDPEAAAVVFDAPWSVTMVGLDVTHQARCTRGHQERLAAAGPAGRYLAGLLDEYRTGARTSGDEDPAMHDPVALAAAIRPELLRCEPATVVVETVGAATAGMTVVDFAAGEEAAGPLHRVGTVLDVDGFWAMLLDAVGRLGPAL